MGEIEIIKSLLALLSPLKVYADELPLNFDFSKGNGNYYIIDSVSNFVYKNSYNLEIHLVGMQKLDLLRSCEEVTIKLNKAEPTKASRIIKKNVSRNYLREEDGKHHYILEFYIEEIGGI